MNRYPRRPLLLLTVIAFLLFGLSLPHAATIWAESPATAGQGLALNVMDNGKERVMKEMGKFHDNTASSAPDHSPELASQWTVSTNAQRGLSWRGLFVGAGVITLLAVLGYGWMLTLLRQVAVRTAELEDEMTRRQLVEEEREQYFKFFQTSADLMVIADPNGAFKKTNPACTEILGYSAEELVSKPFIAFIHPDDQQATVDEMAAQLRRGYSLNFENRYLCQDGTVKWLSWRAIYNRDEGVTYATARDISKRKQAEMELRKNQTLLVETERIGNVGGWELDIDTGTLSWTEEIYRIHEVDHTFEPTMERGIGFYTPASRAIIEGAMQRAMNDGQSFDLELEIVTAKGNGRHVHAIGKADVANRRVHGFFQDITERKMAQQKLQDSKLWLDSIYNSLDETVLVVTPASIIMDVNRAAEKMFGYSRQELFSATTEILHVDHEHYLEFGRRINDAFTNNRVALFEFESRHKNGTIFASEHSVSLLKNSQGEVLGMVSVVRDITERKRAGEQAARALKEKTVLLQEIHHRVKNNMQVIYSLLNLQAKGISDQAVRAKFEESRDRVLSMALIHEQLYRATDLARVDFKRYLHGLIHHIADTYQRHDVTVTVDMETVFLDVNIGIPCGLIVNELVSNSLKYAFPQGRAGAIRVGIIVTGMGDYLLFVEDNGIGLPQELDVRGTSTLGLQLVNGLSSQIHGQIELNRVDGTRFAITFPAPTVEGNIPPGEKHHE